MVGAYGDDDNGKTDSGSVYVFTRSSSNGAFAQQTYKLYASDANTDDRFGWSVSLYGDTALIGAIFKDPTNEKRDAGSVYVFTRSSSDEPFVQHPTKLTASDATTDDSFGRSISLYGDTALIGAVGDDYNHPHGNNAGSVYVFTRTSSGEAFEEHSTKLKASDMAGEDFFGSSVSLYGDTALIGALYDDDNNKIGSGSVYVFTRPNSNGVFTQHSTKLTASDPESGVFFGSSVSLHGDTALIGAPYDEHNNLPNSGSVYVFTRSLSYGGVFTERSKNYASNAQMIILAFRFLIRRHGIDWRSSICIWVSK